VPDEEILGIDVALRKEDYGAPGSSDYHKNMAMATTPLTGKFGVSRHKITREAQDGDETSFQHVQHSIVNTLHRVNEGLVHSQAMDFMDICTLSRLRSHSDSEEPSEWFDDSEINLWTDLEKCSFEQVSAWQWCVNKRFCDGDLIASLWLYHFVYKSSTDALRTEVRKAYKKIPANQRGEVMYLYLTLCEMFQMSREVKEAMLNFLDLFKRKGIARYTGENVLEAVEEVLGVCKRLDSVNALQEEHLADILTGLSICSNTRFHQMFQHLKELSDLDQVVILPTIKPKDSLIDRIDAVLEKAVNVYDKFSRGGYWNKTSKGGPSLNNALVQVTAACWNCGDPAHGVSKCPKSKDQAKIAKNKKAFEEQKKSQAQGSGSGSRAGNQRGGQCREKQGGLDKNAPDYQRKVWEAAGITVAGGQALIRCKLCGLNATHGTSHHAAYVKDPNNFTLPSTHPLLLARQHASTTSNKTVAPPPSVAPPTTTTTGPVSNASTITFSRADLEARIANYERNSTDPSASTVSDALRAMLLN
jgi:hypothetical protein